MTQHIDLDALQALAEAALWTGDWYDAGCGTVMCTYADDSPWPGETGEIAHPEPVGTSAYIAAANPQTILSLIARIRDLEGDTGKSAEADARGRTLAQGDIEYPRDVFSDLISHNSPYAFYLFQWVPYQTDAKRWRLKMCHDVRTFDGREAHGIWPNGSHCGPFRDEEVELIRISRSQHGKAWEDPRPAAPEGGKP